MQIFLVERPDSDEIGYDEYSAFICAADSEAQARLMHPTPDYVWHDGDWYHKDSLEDEDRYSNGTWPTMPDKVKVTHLGWAKGPREPGIILSSFHAG